MDFGICVASKIDEIGYIAHAENLGYSHAWVADSQMIWSDCYAVLALAAQQTRKIKLGTGVSVAGTRLAPVTANSIATINRLAPGRTFLTGTPEEIIEQIRRLEQAGLHQIMLLPSFETQYRVIEDFARKVMAKL